MSIIIAKAGVQTSLQGAPYSGYRHYGMPAAGAADSLSLALANHLVGKLYSDLAIEISLSETQMIVESPVAAALTGATSYFRINGTEQPLHQTVILKPNDRVDIGAAHAGCRSYFAISQNLHASSLWDGQSTYMPANLGGFLGRALRNGDRLSFSGNDSLDRPTLTTPDKFQATLMNRYILRVIAGVEFDHLDKFSKDAFSNNQWTAGSRSNRMGLLLNGPKLAIEGGTSLPSAPVFPGTIQCPPDGQPFLLGPDAQTTGGYPRIAQVIRADRHLIGQLKPSSKIQMIFISPKRATEIYREKLTQLKPWLGDISLW